MPELTKFKNLSVDTSLGGNNSSDETISSQKAIKHYIDVRKDIPLGYGIWTAQAMDSEIWGTYTGNNSYYTAALYPVMYALLNDIVTGTIEVEEILAMTTTDLSNMPNLVNAQENYTPGINAYIRLINKGINPELALSWFFIVDTQNHLFYVPQNVREINSIGAYKIIVQKGTTTKNGTYEISSYGEYKEVSHFARLAKANSSRGITYNITESLSAQTEIPCITVGFHTGLGGFDFHVGYQNAKCTKNKVQLNFAKTLEDNKYEAEICIAKSNVNKNTIVTENDLDYIYPNEHGQRYHETRTATSYATTLRCWANEGMAIGEENNDIQIIGANETEKYLLLYIEGQTAAIPTVANYNATNKRLYIKIAN